MRKSLIALVLLTILAAVSPLLAAPQDHQNHNHDKDNKDAGKTTAKTGTNKVCPVSGEPVTANFRTEYQGQYVYLCCQGCLDNFKKDPEKFVAKMAPEEREAIKKNDVCPVSKEPVKDEFRVEDNGRLVYFCCASCMDSYKKKMTTKTATE